MPVPKVVVSRKQCPALFQELFRSVLVLPPWCDRDREGKLTVGWFGWSCCCLAFFFLFFFFRGMMRGKSVWCDVCVCVWRGGWVEVHKLCMLDRERENCYHLENIEKNVQ